MIKNKKSFFLGLVTGIVLTFVGLFVIGKVIQNYVGIASIKYLEKPVSYENKKVASFQVFQVFKNSALASESSGLGMYLDNTVLILGKDFYSDQIVTVENPKRVGTYSYTNNAGIPMTVPVINGKMK